MFKNHGYDSGFDISGDVYNLFDKHSVKLLFVC